MLDDTKAWLRVKQDIERYAQNPIEVLRVPALRTANPKSEVTKVAKFQIGKFSKARKAGASKDSAGKFARGEITLAKATGKPAAEKTKTKKKRKARKAKAKAAAPAKRKARKAKRKTRKTAKRKTRKTAGRRKAAVQTEVTRTVKVPKSRTQVVRVELTTARHRGGAKKKKKSAKSRRKNPAQRTALSPPSVPNYGANPHGPNPHEEGILGGLLSNPAGPYSASSLRGYAIAAGGVGAGLVIADFVDRYVATRTPNDSEPSKAEGKHPWYGRDAAAAQRRRPDAMRLGAQAVGAVGAMALTYWTRSGNIMPWLFGGTAVGFGANLLKQLTDWWVMPAIFSVDEKNPGEDSFGNRMFPLEQPWVQDEVDKLFENWNAVPALAAGQQETPTIASPLASPGTGVYVLGKAGSGNGQPQPETLGTPASPQFIHTGRLGKCGSCGGYNGCWSTCATQADCGPCKENGGKGGKRCYYTVQPGDDFGVMISAANADVKTINAMNGGAQPSSYWQAGRRVMLPYEACKYIEGMTPTPMTPTPPVMMPTPVTPREAAAVPTNPLEVPVPGAMLNLSGAETKTPEERVHALFNDSEDN